ncbi:hypothetical protein [Haloferax sp. DFSO60]|uniref:hypothetical protein n=1 Tax=Haloferax sp. DFSO60 TaxID=3388652 RepID=UPI00397A9DCF
MSINEPAESDGSIERKTALVRSICSLLDSYRVRIVYTILGIVLYLSFVSSGFPVIARGALLASVIFSFHETLHSKIHQITSITSIVRKRDEGRTAERRPISAIVGVAIVDLLIAVPMFSSGEYVWPYTLALALHFVLAVVLYGGIQLFQREVKDSIRPYLGQPYKAMLVIVVVFCLDLYFIYEILTIPELPQYQTILAPGQVIEITGESILFPIAYLAVLGTLAALSFLILLASLWLSLIALGTLVPVLLVFSPGLVFTGLETAPHSIRVWAALGVVVFTVISALPSIIKSRGWFLNE